ncbi:DUF2913 family protein [Veronia pacifica]|uniref:DUF2913 family protein n=1 Tax=Veronia pacifica TaxID=1080227 RepID=A0A1C3ED94_9GAMM|nr:DUF2913 family protein [Veronia pacifica]ODA31208.1 hypothetical protein A8L45_17765 [Veronia pacifica]
MSYVNDIQRLVNTALSELQQAIDEKKIQPNPVSEESFLCRWFAQAIKKHRFGSSVANEMTLWVQQGRSMGKNADLKGQLLHISNVYRHFFSDDKSDRAITRDQLDALIDSLDDGQWMVNIQYEINRKVKVISDGQHSFAICAKALESAFDADGKLIKPLSFYVRCPESEFIDLAVSQDMALTKVTDYKSIVKYHAEYQLWPENRANCLAVLPANMKP